MFAFAARFLFSYFIVVKKIIPRNLRDQYIMWKYTEVNRTCVDVTGARGPMVMENTPSIVLTQTSIDHQNLFIVFFMPSKQLQITFIVSGFSCDQVVSDHRPNRTLYTFLSIIIL